MQLMKLQFNFKALNSIKESLVLKLTVKYLTLKIIVTANSIVLQLA